MEQMIRMYQWYSLGISITISENLLPDNGIELSHAAPMTNPSAPASNTIRTVQECPIACRFSPQCNRESPDDVRLRCDGP